MITLDKTLPAGYYYREAWMMQDIWSPDGTKFCYRLYTTKSNKNVKA